VIAPAVAAPLFMVEVIWVISEWSNVTTKPTYVNRIVAIHPPFLRITQFLFFARAGRATGCHLHHRPILVVHLEHLFRIYLTLPDLRVGHFK
jgi:hypothetical protein